jgi:hypothetical protein
MRNVEVERQSGGAKFRVECFHGEPIGVMSVSAPARGHHVVSQRHRAIV